MFAHGFGMTGPLVSQAQDVAAVIAEAMKYLPKEKILSCTNCGMAPMSWDVAFAKLAALGRGAELARQEFG
jgi:5-methyltetrahydropteroyltriglutamate--homocysteine methyltransferase